MGFRGEDVRIWSLRAGVALLPVLAVGGLSDIAVTALVAAGWTLPFAGAGLLTRRVAGSSAVLLVATLVAATVSMLLAGQLASLGSGDPAPVGGAGSVVALVAAAMLLDQVRTGASHRARWATGVAAALGSLVTVAGSDPTGPELVGMLALALVAIGLGSPRVHAAPVDDAGPIPTSRRGDHSPENFRRRECPRRRRRSRPRPPVEARRAGDRGPRRS